MLFKLYLDDCVTDIESMIQRCEAIPNIAYAVYDKREHMIVIECDRDIRDEVQELEILGFEVTS